jgi:hypothetical protein
VTAAAVAVVALAGLLAATIHHILTRHDRALTELTAEVRMLRRHLEQWEPAE